MVLFKASELYIKEFIFLILVIDYHFSFCYNVKACVRIYTSSGRTILIWSVEPHH